MADPDILHELRQLADLSQNLHRLHAVHEDLRGSLAQRLQDSGPAESAVLEAALDLDYMNDVLRKKLALECEQKRYHMINSCKSKHEASFMVQLENAFQLDWYSSSSPSADRSEPRFDSSGRGIEEKVNKWGFDLSLQEQILEALQFVPDQNEVGERRDVAGCNDLDTTPGSALHAHHQPNDYGFPLQDVSYRFDDKPESTFVMQCPSPDSGHESIKAGSLERLIERLTDDKTQDLNLRFVFLLTYHSFTSSREFLNALVERYSTPLPPNTTPNERTYFRNKKQKGIRLKVFSVIKKWVEDHYDDFEQNEDLKHHLKHLLRTSLADEPWSCKLSATILNVVQKQESGGSRNTPLDFEYRSPSPELKFFASVDEIESKLVDISPLELARQLCISDFQIFRRIEARECLNQAWSKPNRNVLAPNIMRMIQRFNHVSQWSQWVVLNSSNRSQRQLCLRQMIRVAERCLFLNNFTSACAIYAGLESNSLYRLRDLWEALPSRIVKLYEALQGTFRSDSKTKQHFRTVLQEAIPPCIPHLGLFLSDLTFIEDGNPDEIGGLVNFSKRRKLSERIMWIKQYQQVGYQLVKVPVLQEYFERSFIPRDDDAFYNLSKAIKP